MGLQSKRVFVLIDRNGRQKNEGEPDKNSDFLNNKVLLILS
jgi:hypothetical protein